MTNSHETVGLQDNPANPSPPRHFEEECIDLLCKQENTVTALAEASSRHRSLDALQLARQMLLQSLDFSEVHFPEEQLQRIGHRLYEINQRTREYENLVQARSFRGLKRLVGMTVPHEEEEQKARQTLRDEYVDFYNGFFRECIERFAEGSPIRAQFLQSVEDFLGDLRTKW